MTQLKVKRRNITQSNEVQGKSQHIAGLLLICLTITGLWYTGIALDYHLPLEQKGYKSDLNAQEANISPQPSAPTWRHPQIQTLPSKGNPFAFLHQRKTAGSALRKWILNRTIALNLTAIIACEDDIPCTTYSLEQYSNVAKYRGTSVIAGHFPWGTTQTGLFGNNHANAHIPSLRNDSSVSCMTVFREPVARFVSCFSFRQKEWSGLAANESHRYIKAIKDYGMDEWRIVAQSFVDRHGMGCNNEAFRILLGWGDEALINTLSTVSPHIQQLALAEAKRHAETCVVGLVEEMDLTMEIIKHFFPWMKTNDDIINDKMEEGSNRGVNMANESLPEIPESHLEIIRSLNTLELELYKHIKVENLSFSLCVRFFFGG